MSWRKGYPVRKLSISNRELSKKCVSELWSCKGWGRRITLPSILPPPLTLFSCAACVLLLTISSKWRGGLQAHQGQEPTTNSCHFFQFKEGCILCSVSQTLCLFVKTNKAERMVDGQLQGKYTSQVSQ